MPTPSTTSDGTLTVDRASELRQQVLSGEDAKIREALAIPDGQEIESGFADDLSSFESFEIDPTTFQSQTADTGTVTAEVTAAGDAPTRWTLDLLLVDGKWKIAATRPDSGQR